MQRSTALTIDFLGNPEKVTPETLQILAKSVESTPLNKLNSFNDETCTPLF